MLKELIGEALGTFVLVVIGCGTVAIAVLFGVLNLYGVALFFGMGVSLAIYASKSWCPAHLNPAVSIAMAFLGKLSYLKLLSYIISQFIGAVLGGMLLLLIFNTSIASFESIHDIERGHADSYYSAVMFGEFFPNPGFEQELEVSHIQGVFWEAIGTFGLMLVILFLPAIHNFLRVPSPIIVGLTVTVLIIFIAPYTQGGFNPARDFGPRTVAYFGGWGDAAFPKVNLSFFTVYILGPILGSVGAAMAFTFLKKI